MAEEHKKGIFLSRFIYVKWVRIDFNVALEDHCPL